MMAAAEFSVGPASKKARVEGIDPDSCVFCLSKFTKKNPATSPDVSKLSNLFKCCRDREDEIGKKLLAHEAGILHAELEIKYHRNCRDTYCSPKVIKRILKKRSSPPSTAVACSSSRGDGAFTRSKVQPGFDWKLNCFICNAPCHPKLQNTSGKRSWSLVETAIDKHGENIYNKVLAAAEDRCDVDTITRLRGVPNGDLVAIEARYHQGKNCLSHYISQRNVSSTKKDAQRKSVYCQAISKTKDEFYHQIMEDRDVFLLTSMRARFAEIVQEIEPGDPVLYKSCNFKTQLQKEWPELCFIAQPGKSDLVCSQDISVGEALQKANQLAQVLKQVPEQTYESGSSDTPSVTDDSIVHLAVGILRRRMTQVKQLEQQYYSSQEMSLDACRDFVDPLLLKTIGWLTDGKLYRDAKDIPDDDSCRKYLSLACDIVYLSTSVMSPKHLGLAVQLHHDFGSRKLVEGIHSLGHCISYPELRQFLTSAAVHVSSGQQPGPAGSLVPPELVPIDAGGRLIVAAGDNWDHNERTVDGKRTTHAMTSILISAQTDQQLNFPRIPKVPSLTFDLQTLPGL